MKIGDFHLLINSNFLKCVNNRDGQMVVKERRRLRQFNTRPSGPTQRGSGYKNPAALISAKTYGTQRNQLLHPDHSLFPAGQTQSTGSVTYHSVIENGHKIGGTMCPAQRTTRNCVGPGSRSSSTGLATS